MLRDPIALRRADRAAILLLAERLTVNEAEALIDRKLPRIYHRPESRHFAEGACGNLLEKAVAKTGGSLWAVLGRELDRQAAAQ